VRNGHRYRIVVSDLRRAYGLRDQEYLRLKDANE
jgi:hypothetical protein